MDTRSFLLSRPVRIGIDLLFLFMSGVYVWQDADTDDRFGTIFWGVFVAFWLVMLVIDAIRTPRGARVTADV